LQGNVEVVEGFIDHIYVVEVGNRVGADLLIQHAGGAQHGGLHIAAGDEQKGDHAGQQREHNGIGHNAGGDAEFQPLADVVERIVPDEFVGPVEPVHNAVAGIYAGGAVDAFQLRSVAYVDAGRAHIHTQLAIHAVALHRGAVFGGLAPGFAALIVVGHHDGVFVEQYALQPAVRANHEADLLAHVGKHKEEHKGEHQHGDEAGEVAAQGLFHDVPQLINADDIGQEDIGNAEGDEVEERHFKHLLPDLTGVPGALVQAAALVGIALYEIFNFAEDELHEDRLRAGISAEDAPEEGGKEDDEDDEGEQAEGQQEEVLWKEAHAKNDEAAFHHVEQEHGVPMDMKKGADGEAGQEEEGNEVAYRLHAALHQLGVYPYPFAFFADGGNSVAEGGIVCRPLCFFVFHTLICCGQKCSQKSGCRMSCVSRIYDLGQENGE